MSYNPKNPRPVSTLQPLIKSTYSPKLKVSITFPEDSLHTKQEFADECDINVLLARYQNTGEIPNINERAPQYLDATGHDFQTHMDFIAGAKSLFQEMPSAIRNRFDNDPAKFLDFTSQEKNRPEMAEMGLLKPQREWTNTSPATDVTTAEIGSQAPKTPNPINQPGETKTA